MTAAPTADAAEAAGAEVAGSAVTAGAEAKDSRKAEGPVEGVEIPKQQSAEEAADSEAGEGARK